MLTFTLSVPPSTNKLWRPRAGTGGFVRSKEYIKWREETSYDLATQSIGIEPYVGCGMGVSVHAYFDSARRDLDGVLKPLLDVLQGVCFANDRQVKAIFLHHNIDKANPRVEVSVWALADEGKAK